MPERSKRILVLGGRNQICLALCEALSPGDQLFVVSRGEPPSWFRASASAHWLTAIPEKEFDCAILIGPLDLLARQIKDVPLRHGILGFSSMSVLEKRDSVARYDRRLAERLRVAEDVLIATADAKDLKAAVFRPTMIYGKGLDQNLTRMARWIAAGRRLPVCRPTGLRQPVHADDLAAACISWVHNSQSGVYEVGGGERLTYETMARRVFASLERRPRFLRIPQWLVHVARSGATQRRMQNVAMLLRMSSDLVADNQIAEEELGFTPRPFHPKKDTWSPPSKVS